MDLPKYLKDLSFEKISPPASNSEKKLPFERMDPLLFERFCCDLLIRRSESQIENTIANIIPIDGHGKAQYGSDIFVLENNGGALTYSLYEVKRIKKFTKNLYFDAVQRFMENRKNWGFSVHSFYLMISHNLSADVIVEWTSDAARLSEESIEFQILIPSNYQNWVRSLPEIVYEYFHPIWVELYFGKHGLWHLEKFGIYKFKESESWEDYQGEEEYSNDDTFRYINDFVKLHFFLPTSERRKTSCLLEFRNGRYSYVLLTLTNDLILEKYFRSVGSSVEDNCRPFLMKQNSEGTRYICDVGNCRLTISKSEAEALCRSFDKAWVIYKERIIKIEKLFKTNYFQSARGYGSNVPLIEIDCSIWHVLKIFAKHHDFSLSNSDWNIFDSSSADTIKIFTPTNRRSLAPGYHCIFLPVRSNRNFTNSSLPERSIIILWQHPIGNWSVGEDIVVGSSHYWSAVAAYEFITESLIPTALKWASLKNKTYYDKIVDFFRNKQREDIDLNYYSFYKRHSIEEKSCLDYKQLVQHINSLQTFFSSAPNQVFVPTSAHRSLFEALYLQISKVPDSEFNYICGNLGFLKSENMADLREKLSHFLSEISAPCTNSFRINLALRCLQASVSYERHQLVDDIFYLYEKLDPLLKIAEDYKLVQRQLEF